MANYWQDRQARAQAKLMAKSIEETEEQLIKYYSSAQKKIIGQFEKTYDKLLLSISDGRTPTPADLYKLNTYWEMQGQLTAELQKLWDKQAALLSKKFIEEWENIYRAVAIKDDLFFSEIDRQLAQQMINNVWCADGLTWSERVWKNTNLLKQELNDQLINCVVTGKKTSELKNLLQERFGVSYHRADTLVRTEMAHIQTQAAQQRYKNAGVAEVEIWADKDERRCDVCGQLHKKRFAINATLPIPAHPRCRCCVLPVVDTKQAEEYERLGYKENPQPRKTIPKVAPQQQNLTLQNNNGKIQLDIHQQRAQDKVKELQKQGDLHFYKRSKSHQQHAEDLTGKIGDAAWAEYEKMASDFLKKDIDGITMDGFMSAEDWLFKFEQETGLFGILSNKGTISTLYVPTEKAPEAYWRDQVERFKPKEK